MTDLIAQADLTQDTHDIPPAGWGPGPRRIHRGASSELRACAALLDAGYHVFRSESPQAPFDLVAAKGGDLFRVEVKSVTVNPPGTPVVPWPRDDSLWDMLIYVGPGRVFRFETGTSKDYARDVVREYYGFPALGDCRQTNTTRWRERHSA